ncbi:META domain-containing protein [Microbacterium sp. MYb62]|uniref:META domain-containing protein n=1 Tax=Microbacterium sp. MYb62 TaxID=1848690 RepID=UPI000CFC23E0|nr:META domain-containing protein [Microbacterium sp. MYb62]PRB16103.1 hypothetical protein CQ042_08290 [Microbacterium sp. MYb62]
MRAESSRLRTPDHDRPSRLGLAVSFWILIPMILFGAHWMQIFESFGVVGCEGDCDLELSLGARAAYPWAVGASVVAAVVAAVVFRLRGKPAHWGPLLGVILVLLSAIATSIVFQVGLAPMHERNDRIANGEARPGAAPPLPDPVGVWEASVDGAPSLRFSADGTVTGDDGCNDLSGRWTQDSSGRIDLEALLPQTTNVCEGVDTWLSGGRSADIFDDYMYVNGDLDSPIGGLQPAR